MTRTPYYINFYEAFFYIAIVTYYEIYLFLQIGIFCFSVRFFDVMLV